MITEFNVQLAMESERKKLDLAVVAQGVLNCLKDPWKGRYFIALAEEEVVGQLMITLEWSDWRNGWIWWIQSVYVKPGWRKKGVFRGLFHKVEEEALLAGDVASLRLYVEQHNYNAKEVYKKMGLLPAGYEVLDKPMDKGQS
ncbi:MAG: GNAT family N-acetyltransferase [Gemmataceae bacterium]|nr:GNAT family N-acetyltransferase [Gemmataceae bacterium]